MRGRLVFIVEERRSRWRREWDQRLRAEPVLSAMAEPAILTHLMDETFAQFSSLLGTRPNQHWLDKHRPSLEHLQIGCRCGLNPLLTYFATGQVALESVLREPPKVLARQRIALQVHWHFLAQREIESLCGSCARICAPSLAVSRDTPPHLGLRSDD